MGKSQKGGSIGSQRAKKDKSRKQVAKISQPAKIYRLRNFRYLTDFCRFYFLLFFFSFFLWILICNDEFNSGSSFLN